MVFSHAEFRGHEHVQFVQDAASGLRAIIAVHDSSMGPGMGGCRAYSYDSEDAALRDVLRLSHGMTFKNAIAGVPYGGAKSVILTGAGQKPTREQRYAFAKAVERLGGYYQTAEDVGTSTEDVVTMSEITSHVRNLPLDASGKPAPFTAMGVFSALKAGWSHVESDDLQGVTVAVEGLGAVGMNLCKLLHDAGARLVVCDVDASAVRDAIDRFGARQVDVGTISAEPADIYAPCALGATLNSSSIPQLKSKVIAGGANNQLHTPEDGQRLADMGVTFCPDFVANAGGVLSIAPVGEDFDAEVAFDRARSLEGKMSDVLQNAKNWGVLPEQAAERMAREVLEAAKAKKYGVSS